MKNKAKIFILFILLFFIAVSSYLFFRLNKFQTEITNNLKKVNIDILVVENVEIDSFIFPTIKLKNVNLQYSLFSSQAEFHAEELKLIFSLKSLFSNELLPSDIKFYKKSVLKIDTKMFEDKLFDKIYNNKNFTALNSVNFENLRILAGEEKIVDIKNFNIKLSNFVEVAGEIIENHDINKVYFKYNNQEIKINSQNSIYNLDFKGSLVEENVNGVIKFEIDNNKEFLKKYFDMKNFDLSSYGNTKISSNINLKKDTLNLTNLAIESDSWLSSGSVIIAVKDDVITTQANLEEFNIKNINIFSKVFLDNMANNYKNNDLIKVLNIFLPETNHHKLTLNFKKGKVLTYPLLESHINIEVIEGKIILLPSNFDFGKMKSSFYGMVLDNKYRKAFEGNINFIGSDINEFASLFGIYHVEDGVSNFIFNSDIFISSKELRIYNTEFKSGERFLQLKASIKNSLDTPNYDFSVIVKNFILNENIALTLKDIIKSKMNQATQVAEDLQWLRKVNFNLTADINLFDLNIADENYKHLGFEVNLRRALSNLSHFKIESDKADFKMNLMLEAQALKPRVSMELYGNKVDLDYFYKPLKGDNKGEGKFENAINYLKDIYIEGVFDLNMKSILYNQEEYKSLSTKFSYNQNQLTFNDLQLGVLEGRFAAAPGSHITFNPYSIYMAFAINNAIVNKLPIDFIKDNYLSGHLSANGRISSTGNNYFELKNNLWAEIKIAAIDLVLNKFNIDNIINATSDNQKLNKNEIAELFKNFNKGSTTIHNADGEIKIDKGILKTDNITFKTDRTTGAIGGSINLKNQMINMISQLAFIPKPNEKILNMQLIVQDSLAEPKISIDAPEIKDYLSKK